MNKSLVSLEAVYTHTNTLVTIIANSCKTFIVQVELSQPKNFL